MVGEGLLYDDGLKIWSDPSLTKGFPCMQQKEVEKRRMTVIVHCVSRELCFAGPQPGKLSHKGEGGMSPTRGGVQVEEQWHRERLAWPGGASN